MRSNAPKGPSIVMLLLVLGVGVTPTACKPAESPKQELPSYCYDEASFTAALSKCAATASSRPNSRACRADVHSSCGLKVPQ